MNGINTGYGKTEGIPGVREDAKSISNTSNTEEKKEARERDPEVIFAGNLKLSEDPVASTQAKAQRDALKTIMDTFTGEHKVDEEVKDKARHIEALDDEIREFQEDTRDLRSRQAALKEDFAVADDSEEAQELELLKREMRSRNPRLGESISFEEQQQAAHIRKRGLTEYQEGALSLYRKELYNTGEIMKRQDEQREDTAYIKGVREARWKRHDMVDSRKRAENILDAASDEVKNIIANETMENLDEKLREEVEKAEENAADKGQDAGSAQSGKTPGDKDTLKDMQSSILRGEAQQRVAEHKLTREDVLGLVYDEEV